MGGPDEPEEIRRLRVLDARVDGASRAFTGDPAELEEPLRLLEEAIPLAGGRTAVLAYLAGRRAAVWGRWADVAAPAGRRGAREAAVEAGREALATTPEGSRRARLIRATNLAADLVRLHGVTGARDALDEAVDLLGEALVATPRDDPAVADRAANLAAALEERFTLAGQDDDLDVAVAVLDAVAVDHPGHVATAVNLAAVLRTRFRARGDEADLDAAETGLRRVLNAAPEPEVMSGLGLALLNRYEVAGGEPALDEAVRWLTAAVDATPPRSGAQAARLNNLALALLLRGEFRTGAPPDFDRAVGLLRDAVDATPPGSTERAARLTNLGGGLRRRAAAVESVGSSTDLDDAVTAYREALALTPPGHVHRYAYLANLANGLRDRYQRTGTLADLDEAIDTLTANVDAPNAAGHRADLLSGLGIALGERAERTGDTATREDALTAFREALALTPDGSPTRLRRAVNLAIALHARSADGDLAEAVALLRAALALPGAGARADRAEATNVVAICLADVADRTRAVEDVRAAVAAARAALDATPAGSPSWPERASNLAVVAGDHGVAPTGQVEEWFTAAVDAAVRTNSSVALYTAGNWARWAENRSDWDSATTAYRRALDAAGLLDRAQLSRRDRERWLTAVTGLGARAGYAALSASTPDAASALHLVDRGQAVLLASTLRMSGPDDGDRTAFDLADVSDEPVVCLGATARGGYALLLLPDGCVRYVLLPGLTSARVRVWADTLARARPGGHLRPLLAQLWDEVMEPVLAALPAATSRLTLLPAGSTRLLPLHAAVHRQPDGHASALLDRVVVSYTPNLHALREARRRPAAPVEPVLVVGDPVDLRFSDLEIAAVRQHFPAAGPSAETTAAVRDALPGAGLVHLACHGLADRDDPAHSRLLLADGELSVQEILRLAPRRDRPARLVVLSACESATIGDVLPDEAVSLPVALAEWGASAVVGSLWRVADESTAIMIRHFYDAWRGPTRPTLPAALATAQRRLRTQTNAELLAAYPEVFAERARAVPARRRATWESARRYDDPYFWAPFLILGR